jgi:NitT/TauT family transport system substrate-binding protein
VSPVDTPELAAHITRPAWLEDRAPAAGRAELVQDLMIDYGSIDVPVDHLDALAVSTD